MYNFFTSILYILLILSLFSTNIKIISISIYIASFFLLKWIFNFKKCTLGYLECKIRNVSKSEGYINKICNDYGDMINDENVDLLFIISFLIIITQFIKLIFILKYNDL